MSVGPVALESISVIPDLPTWVEGETGQFTATGHYSDGAFQALTAVSSWRSESTAVATVLAGGMATARAPGTTRVVAAVGGVEGSSLLTVVPLGELWRTRPAGTSSTLYAVAWCAGQFVAVGQGGALITSPDGIGWTARASGTTEDLRAVACSPGRVIAVGAHGVVASSTDGLSWSASQPGGQSGTAYSLAWTGAAFVAGTEWGDALGTTSTTGIAHSSPDGVTWTTRVDGIGCTTRGIAWGATGGLLACNDALYSATDPAVWTNCSKIAFAPSAVAWSGSKFALVGPEGRIFLMPDCGFVQAVQSGTLAALSGVVWSGAEWNVVGEAGLVLTSRDGISWTSRSSGTTSALSGIAWSGTRLVAVGEAGAVLSSP